MKSNLNWKSDGTGSVCLPTRGLNAGSCDRALCCSLAQLDAADGLAIAIHSDVEQGLKEEGKESTAAVELAINSITTLARSGRNGARSVTVRPRLCRAA